MNRKIFIRKLDIDALFQVDVPYQVKRIEAKPITARSPQLQPQKAHGALGGLRTHETHCSEQCKCGAYA